MSTSLTVVITITLHFHTHMYLTFACYFSAVFCLFFCRLCVSNLTEMTQNVACTRRRLELTVISRLSVGDYYPSYLIAWIYEFSSLFFILVVELIGSSEHAMPSFGRRKSLNKINSSTASPQRLGHVTNLNLRFFSATSNITKTYQ